MEKKVYSLDIGGQQMSAEFNDWADQANGSVLLRYGNSAVLATVVMGSKESDKDYFPLSVEYEEKFYAAGAILGSRFMRREGRPSEEAVLSGRIVDRTIRPLFPQGMKRDVQVMITVLSLEDYDTDILGVTAASLALATSPIPWNGPVSAVRLELDDAGAFIVNPTYKEREAEGLRMDLLACGKDGLINMIEVGANEVSEETLEKAFARASEEIERIQTWQKSIVSDRGAQKIAFAAPEASDEVKGAFAEIAEPKFEAAVFGSNDGNTGKKNIYALKAEWIKFAAEKFPEAKSSQIGRAHL